MKIEKNRFIYQLTLRIYIMIILKGYLSQTDYIVKEKFLYESYLIIKKIINNNFKEK